jgi:hypothetical protein
MKKPDLIWLENKRPSFASPTGCEFYTSTNKKLSDNDTEYIRASLLKDDKWLADNGLMRVKPVKYGCYCDGSDSDYTYNDCVIDSGDYEQCVYARTEMAKEDCEHWRELP